VLAVPEKSRPEYSSLVVVRTTVLVAVAVVAAVVDVLLVVIALGNVVVMVVAEVGGALVQRVLKHFHTPGWLQLYSSLC